MPQVTILVVEDDPEAREIVCQYLLSRSYHLIEAGDANAALAVLQGEAPVDLLLTDIVMPGGRDGFALAREARRVRPGLKVLHITGYPDRFGAHAGQFARDPVPAQPFPASELLRRVALVLGHWSVDRNPILRQAYAYCLSKAGGGVPDRRQLRPEEIKEILPYLSIIEAVGQGGAARYRYRLVGTRVVEAFGRNPTNHFTDEEYAPADGAFAARMLGEVARSRQPLYVASAFGGGRTSRSTERVLLPFTVGGTAVQQIVVVQTFDLRARDTTIWELA
jgi:CheY-like chemotaxis protein